MLSDPYAQTCPNLSEIARQTYRVPDENSLRVSDENIETKQIELKCFHYFPCTTYSVKLQDFFDGSFSEGTDISFRYVFSISGMPIHS